MCGIVGALNFKLTAQQKAESLNSIAHRGPDHGEWLTIEDGVNMVHLGHRRLSIIDLSNEANQPFTIGSSSVVYNGEVYNYRELRTELQSLGVVFRTSSDTEVVLQAYLVWGTRSFEKLRGMFAFAIYDRAAKKLVLVRDQFGIKPLYFSQKESSVIFSSEIKALHALGVGRSINDAAIWSSMTFLFVPEEQCAFLGIEKLQRGHYFEATSSGSQSVQYWSPSMLLEEPTRSDEDAVNHLRLTLEDSVKVHMASDVPVGTFLSGGLDSSILTVLARRHNPSLEAYTIRTPEADRALEGMPQDIVFARKLAKREGIRLHEVDSTSAIRDWLPRMMHFAEEPVSDPAAVNVMLMCSMARQNGAKVLLSGMGADELFGGYRRHQAMLMSAVYKNLPAPFSKLFEGVLGRFPVTVKGRALVPIRWAKRFVGFANKHSDAAAYMRSYSYYDQKELSDITRGKSDSGFESSLIHHQKLFEDVSRSDLQSKMSFTDLHYFLPGLNLAYSDRASMSESTEVRTPFVDLRVASAAFSLSPGQKTNLRATKIALKKAAEAWLPKEIIYRPKASFGVPLRSWIRGPLHEPIADLIEGGALTSRSMLDRAVARKMLAEFDAGERDWSYQLWHLLALETWLSQH